jgi:hypothetical protein
VTPPPGPRTAAPEMAAPTNGANAQAATPSAPPLSGSAILALSLWFGLLTGCAEVASILGATYGFDIFLSYWGWQRLWMTPLADALLFLIPGGLLALASRVRPRSVSLRMCASVLGFLGALSLVIFFDRKIHRLAIVAAGVDCSGAAHEQSSSSFQSRAEHCRCYGHGYRFGI